MRVLALALLTACTGSDGGGSQPTGPVDIAALSHPAGYLARRIGARKVKVDVIIPDDADPATWQPSGEVVAGLPERDLVVANGAGFEAWTKTATLPTAKLVDTARGLDLIEIDGPTHSHGTQGEHSHKGVDPHTWADPALYGRQAQAVRDTLVKLDPENADLYAAHHGGLQRDLQTLGEALDNVLAKLGDRPMAANHPAFVYLARRAELELPSLHLDPAEPPDAEAVAAIAERYPEGVLLWWEAPPTEAVRAALPDAVTHLYMDPLEQPVATGSYDYVAQARANVARLERLLAAPGAVPASGRPAGSADAQPPAPPPSGEGSGGGEVPEGEP